jgi:hypothetical protein
MSPGLNRNKMFDFFEKRIYWIVIFSLFNLILGLGLFETTVMKNRFRSEQISSYVPGDKVPFIQGRMNGYTEDNKMVIRDFSGGLIKTDIFRGSIDIKENLNVIITGKVGPEREFLTDEIEIFPYRNLKVIVSIAVLFVVFWKVIKNVELTPRGLRVFSWK